MRAILGSQRLQMLADWATIGLAAGAFVIVRWWPASSIIALVIGTTLVICFDGETAWGVATIGSMFKGIPTGLPAFSLPEIH